VHRDASDAEIVRFIASGGGSADAREAEAELCRRFAPRARLYGLRHLRDEDRARDLAQSVLAGVLVAAREGRIEDPERVDRFILGTCRNVASRMRENEARGRFVVESFEESIGRRADSTPALSPFESIGADVERVDLGALMRCFGGLEERARVVVQLSFQEDRPADDIAARLGTTAGNVRVIRHRAVAALRRCLDAHEQGSP
jgi:RNA polymerase sigma-70 factor (ECF subfamily)